VWDIKILVSGFGFRDFGSGFQVPSFCFRVSRSGRTSLLLSIWPSALFLRPKCTSRLEFRDLQLRVGDFTFQVPDFGSRVSGFGLQVSGFGFRVSGSLFWLSGFRFIVSGFGSSVSAVGFRVSG